MSGFPMKGSYKLEIIIFLLVLLFVYTASSKLLDFEQFKGQMQNQALPRWTAILLIWTLPGIEILTSLLLLYQPTRILGFYIAFALLSLFTLYILLILLNYFGRVPCSCGGVIKSLGWKMHLVFNLFFLLLTVAGISIIYRERRALKKKI
jgi:hypothetical protein